MSRASLQSLLNAIPDSTVDNYQIVETAALTAMLAQKDTAEAALVTKDANHLATVNALNAQFTDDRREFSAKSIELKKAQDQIGQLQMTVDSMVTHPDVIAAKQAADLAKWTGLAARAAAELAKLADAGVAVDPIKP